MPKAKCSACDQLLALDLFHKDASRPLGVASKCKSCAKAYQAAWYQKNKDRRDQQKAQYKKDNAEAVKQAAKRYYERTREEQSEKNRARYARNAEQIRAKNREKYRQEYDENPARIAAKARARELKIANQYRLAPASIKAEIDGIYLFKKLFSGFEIDHGVPMKHKKVCGLHLPANLSPMLMADNRSKGNRFTEQDFALEEARLVERSKMMRAL